MPTGNVELLRTTYEAFGRGDIPAVMGTFREDIEWNAPEVLPHGGRARGLDGVAGFFERLASTWEDFELELNALFGSGERVCAAGRASGRVGGVRTGYGFVHLWTVEDGVCCRFDEFVDPEPELLAR
ncbi:MAG: nuclear transport factor 2 family protein [Actinomycetota bacterium]|nr:nuclear transport factor 2 family protein [Actinomycetota bacterium]